MVLSFDATGLPRIRGKQAPFGGWERMGVNPKVEAKPMVEKGQQAKKCHGRDGVACSFGKNGQALRVEPWPWPMSVVLSRTPARGM